MFLEDFYKTQTDVDNRVCHVEILDTAGQEEYAAALQDQVRLRRPRVTARTNFSFFISIICHIVALC